MESRPLIGFIYQYSEKLKICPLVQTTDILGMNKIQSWSNKNKAKRLAKFNK